MHGQSTFPMIATALHKPLSYPCLNANWLDLVLVLCGWPQLLSGRECYGHAHSRRQQFTALLVLQLLLSFIPSFTMLTNALGGQRADIRFPFMAEHSKVTYSQHFDQFGFLH